MGFFEDTYGINPAKADEMKKAMTQFNPPKNKIWCIFVCTQDKYWQNILTDRIEMLFSKYCFDSGYVSKKSRIRSGAAPRKP